MNTTYLLGAGASKNACMPICNEIGNQNYYDLLGNLSGSPVKLENQDELCAMIQESNCNFEEFISDAFLNNRELYYKLLKFYQETLMTGETIGGTDIYINPNTGFIYAHYYILFASLLKVTPSSKLSVLSFNHDLWIENALNWNDFHYGSISEDSCGINIIGKYSKDYPFFDSSAKLLLLKLHGSFNYLLCESCKNLVVGHDYSWHLYPFFKCQNCQGSVIPYYVPPLKDKEVKMFDKIWNDAAETLQQTEHLIIVGYSLPSYDMASKTLLEKNLNPNAEILIVDKFAREVSKKYSFLPNKTLLFSEIEFEDFVYSILNRTVETKIFNARIP
jgi:hypothetical protein